MDVEEIVRKKREKKKLEEKGERRVKRKRDKYMVYWYNVCVCV